MVVTSVTVVDSSGVVVGVAELAAVVKGTVSVDLRVEVTSDTVVYVEVSVLLPLV